MNGIIKIVISIMIIFLLTAGSAVSVDRIISVTNDNIYTFIRNSNGNYWKANADNIQVAINDLDNNSGIVWLPGNKTFYLSKTIVIHRNIVLDMGGAEFRLPNGVNTNVVELKDGAGIKNGNIDVSGHTGSREIIPRFRTNTSFTIPSACIFLNASSYIESALIENMVLESISDGYSNPGPDPQQFYSSNYSGSGYAIHLFASNVSSPQLISGVKARHLYLRSFRIGIYLNNNRNPGTGENGAFIRSNSFEFIWFLSVSYGVNLSRNTGVSRDKCDISHNNFDMMQYQTTGGSYWGGEELCWEYMHIEGYSNSFTNFMLWDYSANHRGNGPAIDLTSDSSLCYLRGYGCGDTWFRNNGTNNTIMLIGENNINLFLGKITEMTI